MDHLWNGCEKSQERCLTGATYLAAQRNVLGRPFAGMRLSSEGCFSNCAAISDWSAMLQALELPAVAGMHVMPVSKAGRRLAMQLVQENVFQR